MHVVRIPGEFHFKIYIPIKINFQETTTQGPFPHHPFVRRCEATRATVLQGAAPIGDNNIVLADDGLSKTYSPDNQSL